MICQTIAESPDGRLVIQDLFEGMCAKFPEIREWAFGKDWEARVKNRIKSTLSIKGNLFVKQARPSSAAGKGSWWTLSPEAQEQWKAGRVANVLKTNGVGPIGGASSIGLGLGNAAGAIPNSFGASPSGSRPPSALAQGSAPPQPPIGLNTGGGPARASPAQPQAAFGQQAMPALSQAMPAVSAPAPTAPSVGAGVNVEDANGEGPAAKRMRMMDSR